MIVGNSLIEFGNNLQHLVELEILMNKVIIITGAASGIGLHLAKVFSNEQFLCVFTDINGEKLNMLFSNSSVRLVLKHNIANSDEWKVVVEKTLEKYGRIDYLLNVAAIIEPGFVYNTSLESIDKHLDVNVKGTIYGTKLVADIMVAQGYGHIINIASLAGVAPIQGISMYSASKHAVRGYSLAIAQELRRKNVYCSVLCPDLVDTPMLDQQLKFGDETALTFSGNKSLTVKDIEVAIRHIMATKKMEVCVPFSRGLTAKIANFFPSISFVLSENLIKRGRINKERHKSNKDLR